MKIIIPQMRELTNGCITIDAQPCGLVAMREYPLTACKHTSLIRFKSPETHGYAFVEQGDKDE